MFQAFGVPQRIRTDNGVPFASTSALYGLSQLSVWWLRLRVKCGPLFLKGHVTTNGQHCPTGVGTALVEVGDHQRNSPKPQVGLARDL